jgi:two-component sensor histidine kinase
LKKLFNTLVNLGIKTGISALDKRRIKTINLLNLIVAFFLITGLSNYFFIGHNYPVYANLIFLAFNVLSLLLSHYKKSSWAFLIFTLNVNCAIFFINQYYPENTGCYLYYYSLIISVVLLNNPANTDKFAIFHFLICALFFIGNLIIDIPFVNPIALTPEKIKVVWYYNLIISSVVTALMSVLLTRLIHNQNKEIIFQNQDLLLTREVVNASLVEKEVLLAELHHRVKNNLAIIAGLLNLQEEATNNEEAKQVLSDSKTRIMSMALVHKMLYENTELKRINIGKYAIELITELFNSYKLSDKVRLVHDCDNLFLAVNKSIPLGLILNEIVTNSIKYVFKNKAEALGEFYISIKSNKDIIHVILKDNGLGFPDDFNSDSAKPSLGIFLNIG